MSIDWQKINAAVWRPRKGYLRGIERIDPIKLSQLVGIDEQKRQLIDNTERFLNAAGANNALLWGSRGTGKSSLIKALLNNYWRQGLRLIQVDRNDLVELPEIVDEIRDLPQKFIVFCDDMTFEQGEASYRALKSVLDGSIEAPPDNVLIYATSNRRHLLPESMQDNQDAVLVGRDLHLGDTVEEKLALSDRFGLWLSFYPVNWQGYLAIVDHYFKDYSGDRERLHEAAKHFAMARGGSKSGRAALQFYKAYFGSEQLKDC
ncbi:MAG: ATP-binding protein [Candidatus Thiodiazotropha sp. (ex Ctena orbiculata)]|uniref:ATP-binding protein n=1 Tax=Candidatus Thiodiazotropha taylori TaxID=2792791 RepID=A0A9E4N408_9GAMM|nr:ATP-binding protein [Candidatus Thiodiazotropha taylori]MCG7947000.1 ATP-binding protein [Candidatus Thiodiazotropha taylori]MCW4257121.1 ATP-binding protein [Candidatus Thiodiazotropha taylori]